ATFSPDGGLILTGSGSADGTRGQARLWDAGTGRPLTPPLPHKAQVSAGLFAPDGQTFLTVCGNLVHVWKTDPAAEGQPAPTRLLTVTYPGQVFAAVFSRDGRTLLTGVGLFRLDPKTNEPVPAGGVGCLWEAQTGKAVVAPLMHGNVVEAVA